MLDTQPLPSNASGWTQKSINLYIIGFVFCLILTFFSFGAIEYKIAGYKTLFILLGLSAIMQVIIQSICFLGFNTSTEGRWNLIPFIFTLLIIFFLVSGSLWIMYNLNFLMMGYSLLS
jgi:cytochrome o ubiquinol oxidase operon protein cyoD